MALRADEGHEILSTIRKIIRAVDIHSKQLRLKTGITGPQLVLLKGIKERSNNITTTELAELVSLSQATVTNILDRLVEKNYVTRTRNSTDKRMWFLELTPSGQAIVDKSPSLLQQNFIDNFSTLPEWQQTQMLSNLQRIAEMMDPNYEDPVLQQNPNLEKSDKGKR